MPFKGQIATMYMATESSFSNFKNILSVINFTEIIHYIISDLEYYWNLEVMPSFRGEK